MNIGIPGTGDVGRVLGAGFARPGATGGGFRLLFKSRELRQWFRRGPFALAQFQQSDLRAGIPLKRKQVRRKVVAL